MEKLFKLEKEAVDIIKSFPPEKLFLSFSGGIDSTVINYIIKKNKIHIQHIFLTKMLKMLIIEKL
jgi:PP-loop superfamily ATP-utilizing enzyme